jgi:hypothetical protein
MAESKQKERPKKKAAAKATSAQTQSMAVQAKKTTPKQRKIQLAYNDDSDNSDSSDSLTRIFRALVTKNKKTKNKSKKKSKKVRKGTQREKGTDSSEEEYETLQETVDRRKRSNDVLDLILQARPIVDSTIAEELHAPIEVRQNIECTQPTEELVHQEAEIMVATDVNPAETHQEQSKQPLQKTRSQKSKH